MSDGLPDRGDLELKRLRFRAWRRGFRELDLLMGGFVDRHGQAWSAEERAEFDRFLDQPDQDFYAWAVGAAAPPAELATPFFARLRDFIDHFAARDG